MSKNAKRTIAIILFLAVAAACICTLPWPTRFEYTFYGAQVDADGTVIETGKIELSGTRYDYLFKNSKVKLDTVTLPGLEIIEQDLETMIYTRPNPEYEYMPCMAYVPDVDRFVRFALCLSAERDNCILKVGPWYFVGSIQEDFDPVQLLDACAQVIE